MKFRQRHIDRRRRRRKTARRARAWIAVWLAAAAAAVLFSHGAASGFSVFLRPAESETAAGNAAAPETAGGGRLSGGLELPATGPRDTVIYNETGRYAFLYRPAYKVSRWVAYKLTRSDVEGGAERSNVFLEDPRLARYGWPSATNADYKGSGYDRGHLLPSADRKCSPEANRATFLYSNMAPQLPRLNRGAWAVLENRLRRMTADYDTLYIVVGTVIDRPTKSIGDGVAVPRLFFKAVALRRDDVFRSEAYVMPNSNEALEGKSYYAFRVTVDSVERLTGLDLFPRIDGHWAARKPARSN